MCGLMVPSEMAQEVCSLVSQNIFFLTGFHQDMEEILSVLLFCLVYINVPFLCFNKNLMCVCFLN